MQGKVKKNKMISVRFVIGILWLGVLYSLFIIFNMQCAGTKRNCSTQQWLIYGMTTDNEFHHDSIELLLLLFFASAVASSVILSWSNSFECSELGNGCVLESHEMLKVKNRIDWKFNVGQFRNEKQKCQIQRNRCPSIRPFQNCREFGRT